MTGLRLTAGGVSAVIEPIRRLVFVLEAMKGAGIDAVLHCRSVLGRPDPFITDAGPKLRAEMDSVESDAVALGVHLTMLVERGGFSAEFLVKGLLAYLTSYYRVMAESAESPVGPEADAVRDEVSAAGSAALTGGPMPETPVLSGVEPDDSQVPPLTERRLKAQTACLALESFTADGGPFGDAFWREWRLGS